MKFSTKYGTPFFLLLITLSAMTLISIYLYTRYDVTANEVNEILVTENIKRKTQLFENFAAQLVDDAGNDFITKLEASPTLRSYYEKELAILLTDDIQYLYILYQSPGNGKLRYLLDTSTDPEERGEFGQKFDPRSDIWAKARAQQKTQTQVQHELDSLWISYVHPIIIDGRVAAYLAADFSHDEYYRIRNLFSPLSDLYFYTAAFMTMILVIAYIQVILYYFSRKRSLIDPLTQVHNRQFLFEQLSSIDIREYQLLIVDLDHFKQVNDHYGHDVGDIVLQAVAGRIKSQIRDDDIFVRYGGEEFLLLIYQKSILECKKIADRIHDSVGKTPIRAGNHIISMTLSIGINPYPGYAKNVDEAIKIADEQLYQAKLKGRNRVEVFEEAHRGQSITSKRFQDVTDALSEGRIRCMYQPIVNTATMERCGYEMLVRMIQPDGGIVTPDLFLPAIAHTEVYTEMTRFVLETALEKIRETPLNLHVNLTLKDIFNTDIMAVIVSLLVERPKDARRLTFEILETENVPNIEVLRKRIEILKNLGVSVAVDDFGSGYANFNYLVDLGIDILKIDSSLTHGIHRNDNTYNIVQMISEFARRLEIRTIAAQIESEEELNVIRELEIDAAQGYYLGRPDFKLPGEKRQH
jgi:diguanylate cyclase (GGDEF)-like protein